MEYSLFSGSSNVELAKKIAGHLGRELSPITLSRFSDGEKFVRIETTVRGQNIFIIQSTCNPTDENLMEMLIMVDAFKRASVNDITAIIPYFGYARQDRKSEPRVPITSKLVADLLTVSGVDRIITMNLHTEQLQGFFNIPVDNLYSSPITVNYLLSRGYSGENTVVVSPDAGGAVMARAYAKMINSKLAVVDKRRTAHNVSKVMNVIGDVENKKVVIVDDMIDTAGTLTSAAHTLKERGAKNIISVATHGVLSGPAIQRINDSPLEEVVVSDTIDTSKHLGNYSKIKVLSVSKVFADAIYRVNNHESITSLFDIKV